ncbi:MAG: geranylgeranyl reductase family protein [Proteobacteria bacterium]|nr:geranylgeranyl reductase family protein [Pseudomonadota bacterium]
MLEEKWDVIVAGGGPAGATAAYLLAGRGLKVLVLDKQRFPRPKLCAGLITLKTVKLLGDLFSCDPDALRKNRIIVDQARDYAISYKMKRLVRGKLDFPFHIVDREFYDHHWLKTAEKAGARIVCGENVVSLDVPSSTITTQQGNRFQADVIIGADGASSRIRSELVRSGLATLPNRGRASGLEVFVKRKDAPNLPDFPVLYFGFIPWGYAWCFPHGDEVAVGICGLTEKRVDKGPKTCFRDFLASLEIPEKACSKIKGHPLPYGNFLKSPGHDNVLLVGDAAGFADPLLGEGIYYAHKSGALAAEAVQEAARKNGAAFDSYVRNLQVPILQELEFAGKWRKLVHKSLGYFGYRPFGFCMNLVRKMIEETIQGERSFVWFRRL